MPENPYILFGTNLIEIFDGELGTDDPVHSGELLDEFGNVIYSLGDPVLPFQTNMNLVAADPRVGENQDVVTLGTQGTTLADYLKKDGSVELTATWDVGSGQIIQTDLLTPRVAATGIRIQDINSDTILKFVGRTANLELDCELGDVDGVGNGTVFGLNDITQIIAIDAANVFLGNAGGSGISVLDDMTQGDGKFISTDEVRARDGDGLKLYDDDSNGIFVEDGGDVGIGTVSPDAPLEIETSATVGQQAMTIDQNDEDQVFIDFQGTSAADVTKNISTLDVAGDSSVDNVVGPKADSWVCQGMIKVEVTGVGVWIPFYGEA